MSLERPTPRQTSRLPRPTPYETERYRHQRATVRCVECDARVTDENPFCGTGCTECTEGGSWE